jgi:hypothetical protein
MRYLRIEPNGWPCTLMECPPGPFVIEDRLCFKSEYGENDGFRYIFNESGEFFHFEGQGPTVQPVIAEWHEEDII